MQTKNCPHCGAPVPINDRFCGECGRPVDAPAAVVPPAAPPPSGAGMPPPPGGGQVGPGPGVAVPGGSTMRPPPSDAAARRSGGRLPLPLLLGGGALLCLLVACVGGFLVFGSELFGDGTATPGAGGTRVAGVTATRAGGLNVTPGQPTRAPATPRPDTPVPADTDTPAPADTDTPEAPQADVFVADDFSDPDALDWNLRDNEDYRIAIEDGQMLMNMIKPEWAAWSTAGRSFEDGTVRVEAAWVDGADDNEFGVLFRVNEGTGDDEFYSFGISATGEYSLWLREGGDWTELIPWTESPAISTGQGDFNTIEVIVEGSDFTFLINGEEVDSLNDSALERGKAGLYLASSDAGDTTVVFDNFQVLKPVQ
jgi:hypothetical protein